MNTVATGGSAQTVALATAPVWDITLTAACTIGFSGFTNGQLGSVVLYLRENGTGGYGVTWTGVTWPLGSEPSRSTAPNTMAQYVFESIDGGTTIYGHQVGSGYGGMKWTSGTAMPGSPSTNDRVTRTDLALDFYYDGTRWLSTTLYIHPLARDPSEASATTAAGLGVNAPSLHNDFDLYLIDFLCTTYVSTTNEATKYWTVTLEKRVAGGTATSIVSFNTSADTVNNWVRHKVSINALLGNGTTYPLLDTATAKTSTPGAMYYGPAVTYRLVGT